MQPLFSFFNFTPIPGNPLNTFVKTIACDFTKYRFLFPSWHVRTNAYFVIKKKLQDP